MKWTRAKPTKPGVYWHRNPIEPDRQTAVLVSKDWVVFHFGEEEPNLLTEYVVDRGIDGFEWFGPLPYPEWP